MGHLLSIYTIFVPFSLYFSFQNRYSITFFGSLRARHIFIHEPAPRPCPFSCFQTKTNVNLEEKEKQLGTAEEDVGSVARRIVLLEYEAKDADTRLGDTVKNLAYKSKEADQILKKVSSLYIL